MRRLFHLIIYIAVLLSASEVSAQEKGSRQFYDQAESAYRLGKIEQAMQLLDDHIGSFHGSLLQSAYRLLALCNLALDQNEQAEKNVAALLKEDPYYTTTTQDPQRFVDMVEAAKLGAGAVITTASFQAEDLSEAPVPAILITEEMIRDCGGQNLQEVLAAYVPGMHIVDCNTDINIAMRGIYGNGQEKILIMLNGHRLNSYSTNIAAPNFSISLDELKQIEVLRGASSSLYGGVSLTAVINLITKQGADVDGLEAKAEIGNYKQIKGSLVFGKRYFDFDVLVWGSIYRSGGEKYDMPLSDDDFTSRTNTVTIGRIGSQPSADLGIQLKWKGLQFLYDTHSSQVIPPLTMSTLAKPYQLEKFRTIDGLEPSSATYSHHLDLSYQWNIRNLNLKANIFYDNGDLVRYQAISDEPIPEFGSIFPNSSDVQKAFEHGGTSRYINTQDHVTGAQVKGDFNYINRHPHKGTLTFGAEYSHFKAEDMRYHIGYDYVETTLNDYKYSKLGKGHEDSYNAFLQLKHHWGPLILNAGLRFDHKIRYNKTKTNELSPRVALILVKPKWNVKLSYSKSFVDAPYLYRKTNLLVSYITSENEYIKMEENLQPESLHSLQLTFAGLDWIKGLKFVEINGFYNYASDMIMTHIIEHINEGSNKTIGLELMANYQRKRFDAYFNMSWIHMLKANFFDSAIDTNNNTPSLMSHLVLSWKATSRLKLYSHISFTGKQTTYNTDLVNLLEINPLIKAIMIARENGNEVEYEKYRNRLSQIEDHIIYTKDIDARLNLDLGAKYSLGKLTLGLNIHNLLGTRSFLSGMNTKLVPQKGRWIMGTVAYKF